MCPPSVEITLFFDSVSKEKKLGRCQHEFSQHSLMGISAAGRWKRQSQNTFRNNPKMTVHKNNFNSLDPKQNYYFMWCHDSFKVISVETNLP